MDFTPDEPERPLDDSEPGRGSVRVFGHEVADLPEGAEATGVIVIARVSYPDSDQQLLSFRCTPTLAGWEAEAMVREAAVWVDECRELTES